LTATPAGFDLPKDANGEVLPHDHPNFAGGKFLIRRISAEQIVPDKNRACNRLSSAVFAYDDPVDHLSCDSVVCIEARGKDPGDWIRTDGWIGALTLGADNVRSIQAAGGASVQIGMVPLDDNPCHGGVWAKITRGRANAMLRASSWLVSIPGVEKCDGK
jgi:hypothetical protein